MKAQSSVATHVQEPMKLLGMSPIFLALALVGETLLTLICGFLIGNVAGFVAFIVSLPFAVGYCIKLRRNEPHCDTLFLLPNAFFKGKPIRHLVAGGELDAPRKKRK